MPRKTDANDPADWLWISDQDLQVLRLVSEHEISFHTCRSKLSEVLEKILKAELPRQGWPLEKTHDLQRLRDAFVSRNSDFALTVKPLCDSPAEAYMFTR